MSESSERYRRVAAAFTERVQAVPDDAWDRPAPCEGWVARDVVGHLAEWVPGLIGGTWGLPFDEGPSAADDPAGAWVALDASIQRALDDPATAAEVRDAPMGTMSLEDALDMVVTSDVFLHTWDLARATGGDERLDPDEVHRLLVGMEPMDEVLRSSGHYGPKTPVPDDADEQTKLLAFIGRPV